MRRLVSRITISTTLVFGLSSVALHRVHAADANAGPTNVCHGQPQSWSGYASVAPGDTFATGVNIDVAVGAESTVSSVAVSTGEGGPSALVVRIGGSTISVGASTAGGSLTVSNNGSAAVHLTSVDLTLTQCQQVAIADAPSLLSSGVETSVIHGSARVASEAPLLPETGAASRGIAVGGVVLVGAGVGLLAVARRRRLA
jgi:LPXTG-motif cell wall-anchored protein